MNFVGAGIVGVLLIVYIILGRTIYHRQEQIIRIIAWVAMAMLWIQKTIEEPTIILIIISGLIIFFASLVVYDSIQKLRKSNTNTHP